MLGSGQIPFGPKRWGSCTILAVTNRWKCNCHVPSCGGTYSQVCSG